MTHIRNSRPTPQDVFQIMRTHSCLPVLLFSLAVLAKAASAQTNPSPNLDPLVERLGKKFMDDPKSVGLSIGIYHGGASQFYNFGTVEKGKPSLPTEQTVYEIGSITKAFVSFVLANAVAEKKVQLTDDIRKYLTGSYPNLEYNGEAITLRHLANTTSGLPNWLPITSAEIENAAPESRSQLRAEIYGRYQRKDFFDALQTVKLDVAPGTKPRHSNAAAQLLGYILEDVYHAPLQELVARYLLTPLRMDSTKFASPKADVSLLAKGYDEAGREMPRFQATYLEAAAGLLSCSADLLEFIKFQLNDRNEAVHLTHEKTVDGGGYHAGMNWLIYRHSNGLHQVWNDGGTYGFCSYLVLYPELNSGVVILVNESDDSTPNKLGGIAFEIFKEISRK